MMTRHEAGTACAPTDAIPSLKVSVEVGTRSRAAAARGTEA